MAQTETSIAIAASKRLKMDGRSLLTLQTFISNALNNLARQTVNDSTKSSYLMTNPASVTKPISNSTFNYYADLSSLIADPQIMLDYLQRGTIFHTPAPNTFTIAAIDATVTISGSGYSAVDGAYTQRGTYLSFPYYNLTGSADSTSTDVIYAQWNIKDSGAIKYTTNDLVPKDYPWLGTWESVNPVNDPAPTVVGTGTDISITAHGYPNGLAVRLSNISGNISGVSTTTTYYVIVIDENTIALATSPANAALGTKVTLTLLDTGTVTITPYQRTIAQWLASPSQGALAGSLPLDYVYIWLENTLMYTTAVTGTFAFNVPYIPTLESVPEALESDLIDQVVTLAISQGFEPNTEAEK